ncbi:MAG: imidazole glycerol phosphate synthase subunit HisH [Pseudomonadota bacterium]
MTVAIVDYGSGNLRSAAKALERAAREGGTNVEVVVSAQPEAVARAERIVLPGVGAFADCKAGLAGIPGMIEALEDAVISRSRPFLGICVGMQLMAERGLEDGVHEGLGWIAGDVVAIEPSGDLKVPHMGWNQLELNGAAGHPLFDGLESGDHGYFVHGYHLAAKTPAQVLARVDYGTSLVAAVGRDNLVGTQFHPEKSQANGLRLLANFLQWSP